MSFKSIYFIFRCMNVLHAHVYVLPHVHLILERPEGGAGTLRARVKHMVVSHEVRAGNKPMFCARASALSCRAISASPSLLHL